MTLLYFFLGVAVLSFWLTRLFKNYALKKQLLDEPNQRSSHTVAIPTSGGIGFIISAAVGWFIFQPFQLLDWISGTVLIVLALCLAIIGYLDDRKGLSVRLRFAAQLLAAILALIILDGMPPLEVMGFVLPPDSIIMMACGVIWIIWLTNLYNFMDGINGLAALEAMSVCLGLAICLFQAPYLNESGFWLILFCALLGFTIWNFPNAKVFMGDVGSVFLGFLFAVFALWLGWQNPTNFWLITILLALFITDSTLTLLKRLLEGQRVYQAHRQHAYQCLADYWNSHAKVSIAYTLINLIWLLPLAILLSGESLALELALVLAYLPLISLWYLVVKTNLFSQEKK